ncbi:ABC transporter substrate-binding protein [Nibricoccus aquaticus]|uniref:ABC transporter substrate-binding protein n=1 Tax=Nibricoccus aquaticus TaxID=2576891 RepID=A0A290Q3H6_9BACT|nr:ABC transporter substrate-binding protein [Nibricoccus aquaticus]ATC63225.1 ABC transporter substrate-binding protein [Nibricoccus aquaticus]
MPRLPTLLLALISFTIAIARGAEPGAVRVVSQTVGTDELLLALAEPSQIAALSHLSRDPQFSAISTEATAYLQLAKNGDAENVLKFSPTLVLVANYSRAELVSQIRRAGVKIFVVEKYESLDDAYANLRALARELGPLAEKKAETIIADCQQRVAALATKLKDVRPIRVIAPSTYGVMGGAGTTFQDLCDHAAAENLAASLGKLTGHVPPPNEQMLTWPIERVVVSGDNLDSALAPFLKLPPYQFLSAVREKRAALLKPWHISAVSHHRVAAYEHLARQLHPELFQ